MSGTESAFLQAFDSLEILDRTQSPLSPLSPEISIQSLFKTFLPNPHPQPNITLRNCHESVLFDSLEGQEYLCFGTIANEEMEAYFNRILQSSLESQSMFMPEELQSQTDRDKMVVTIIQLHQKLNFKVETLHLTVAIADRFLSVRNLKHFQYEIVGITSLWMAAKIEETIIPPFNHWLLLGKGCLGEELVEFESEILKVLDYNLNIPTALSFFNLLLARTEIQQRSLFLCHYLLELSLIDSKYLNYKYNILFTSVYYLSMMLCDRQSWRQERYTKMMKVTMDEIQECAEQLLGSLISTPSHNEISIKFSGECFFRVSQIGFIQQKQRSVSGKSTVSDYSKSSN